MSEFDPTNRILEQGQAPVLAIEALETIEQNESSPHAAYQEE